MIIETASMGTYDVGQEQIYHFPKGIPGFEQETDFAMLEMEEGPFTYLQSLKTEDLSFLLTDPFLFVPKYEFELPQAETEELEINEAVTIRVIVTLRETLEDSTLNLLAPIVLNPDNHMGKQIVLHHSSYSTRYLFLGESKHGEGGSSC